MGMNKPQTSSNQVMGMVADEVPTSIYIFPVDGKFWGPNGMGS